MTLDEALNRGLNFFGTATLAVLATSTIHGFELPYGTAHKIAEIAFALFAVASIVWYLGADLGIAFLLMVTMVVWVWQFLTIRK